MESKSIKEVMQILIDRRIKIDEAYKTYSEMVEMEKEKIETEIGDILEVNNYNEELEDMIPEPICWR